jgi:putative membrane protein
MLVRWLFAWLLLLGLGIGLGAVWARARALRAPLDPAGLRRVFQADGWWGVAAAIWIGTGLVRVIGGLEKGRAARFARISDIQVGLTLLMVLAASAMARGLGEVPRP